MNAALRVEATIDEGCTRRFFVLSRELRVSCFTINVINGFEISVSSRPPLVFLHLRTPAEAGEAVRFVRA